MNRDGFSSEFAEAVWPSLDAGVRDRLELYGSDLIRYNRAQNLVSRKGPEQRVAALIEECVRAGLMLERRGIGGSWSDVGSGGGLPGLVLASMFPDQSVVLIERRQGRCDFLRREVVRLGLAQVSVFEGDVAAWPGEPFDVVFAKAVANPGEIERLCGRVVAGRLVVFGRGSDPVAADWHLEWAEDLPGVNSVLRCLVRD